MTGNLAGLAFREVDITRSDDLQQALRIVSACETAAVGSTEATLDSVRSQLTSVEVAPDHRLFAERDGEPVGLLILEVDRHAPHVFIDVYAAGPGAADVLAALLDHGVALARAVPDSGPIQAGSFAEDAAYRAVLVQAGFTPVRRFWRMVLPLAGRAGVEPSPPPGVTRRTVASDDDRALLHRVFRESFAEHWGTTLNRPTSEWLTLLQDSAGSDPDRWWLAYLDGEPAGLCIADDCLAESGEGHVATLGVLPAARGRGVARWLLECAAADAVARGRTGLVLSVDGENTTGATQLYESVGFRTRQAIDAWELAR